MEKISRAGSRGDLMALQKCSPQWPATNPGVVGLHAFPFNPLVDTYGFMKCHRM